MFRHIPWELVADPLRSADHTVGTTNLCAIQVKYRRKAISTEDTVGVKIDLKMLR